MRPPGTHGILPSLLARFGLAGAVAAVTAASMVASVAVTAAMMAALFGGFNRVALFLSIVVPILCAPVFTAAQLRLIVQLQRAREELRQLSITDDLTGGFNRRHFLDLAQQELARAERYGDPFSLVMMDLDDFKAVNDRHGHVGGDHVIRAVAEACRNVIRATDVFARLGGEEFVLLLPETDAPGALEIAERLRRLVALAPIRWNGEPVRVTTSLGVATWAPSAKRIEELMLAADGALYAAKRAGKNRVVAAEEDGSPAAELVGVV